MSRDIALFLHWCSQHGIEIDARLQVRVTPEDGSWSVWCKRNADIPAGETLVRIPKSSVFSIKTSSYTRDLVPRFAALDDPPNLQLSLTLLLERSLGFASPWHGYLQSLPTELVDVAVFWGTNDDQDGIEARSWLNGTEAGKIINPPDSLTLLDRINNFYDRVVTPILEELQIIGSLQAFYLAYSIVSSRAFIVDSYLGLSLVPVADIFNHAEDNHVHLESDYHVCPICGSLEECGHDLENSEQAWTLATQAVLDTCEMVSKLAISSEEEVFNTYGAELTNAQLLCYYGFILEGNANNVVTWTARELVNEYSAKPDGALMLWTELLDGWPMASEWDESHLVYNSSIHKGTEEDEVPISKERLFELLDLNADGQISHALWLLLFTLTLRDVNVGLDGAIRAARQACQMQSQIEEMLENGANDPGALTTPFGHRASIVLVRNIADFVVRICEDKIHSAHNADMPTTAIGEMLDILKEGTSDDHKLTGIAVSYALEERKLLGACQTIWREVTEISNVLR